MAGPSGNEQEFYDAMGDLAVLLASKLRGRGFTHADAAELADRARRAVAQNCASQIVYASRGDARTIDPESR